MVIKELLNNDLLKNVSSNIPINNALSNYDNEVQETSNGKAGFVNNLLSGGLSLSSIKNSVTNLASSLTGKVGSFLSDGIVKLNELTSGLLGKIPGLNGILGKFGGFLNKYLDSAKAMLQNLLSDTLKQLENATLNFINNIIEDFTKNLMSTMFIPDEIFVQTIKGLYYCGADLAYNNHYLRKNALARDWSKTLEFVDECYGITYEYEYKKLFNDMSTCANSSCADNLLYIYKKVIENIEKYKDERLTHITLANLLKTNNPETYTVNEEYLAHMQVVTELDKIIVELEESLVENLKALIINSYTYVSVTKIKRFFTDLPKGYLYPRYFGTTDIKYNQRYAFTTSDCIKMMPDFKSHEETNSDKGYLGNLNSDFDTLKENAENAAYANESYSEAYDNLEWSQENALEKARLKVNEIVSGLDKNMNEKQSDRYGVLTKTAIKGGSQAVYEVSRSRYPKQNDLPDAVKYKKNVTGAAGILAKNILYNNTEYITLNNKNIKEIYIYLSSNAMWGYNRMVSEAFYERCKFPTMTTLTASLDKARGIFGTSMAVQSLFDVQDAIDRTAYDYTVKMQDFLLDPKNNIDDPVNALGKLTFQIDPNGSELTIDTTEAVLDENGIPLDSDSVKGSNTKTVNAMNKELDSNIALNQEIQLILRYISNVPMITMRDTIIKWLHNFYDFMVIKNVTAAYISHSFSELCAYVFVKTDVTEPTQLERIFMYSNKDSLVENVKVLIYIAKSKTAEKAMNLKNISDKNIIINLFNLCFNMFSREISDIGFIKSLFLYDKEYLKSYLKSLFNNEKEFLKSINDRSKENYALFYPYKDKLTTRLEGFDRFGIFGYNEKTERIQYTNVITGDWKSMIVSKQGTFFGGTDNTENNGIRRLNGDGTEIIKTNINDGTWVNFFELLEQTFFVNSENELYYWDGNNVVSTGIIDFDNWEITAIDNYNLIILLGKNDNGIKQWVHNKFIDVVTSGDDWIIQNCNFGKVIYPTRSAGNPVIVDSSKTFKIVDETNVFTGIGETIKTGTVTGFISVTDPETGQSTSIQKTNSLRAYYIMFGTVNSGFKTYRSIGTANKSMLTKYDENNKVKDVSGLAIPVSVNNDKLYYTTNDGEHIITFVTNESKNNVNSNASTLEAAQSMSLSVPLDLLLLKTPSDEVVQSMGNITDVVISKEFALMKDTDTNTIYIKNFNTNLIHSSSLTDIHSGEIYYGPDNRIYWRYDHGKGLYLFNEGNPYQLLEDLDNNQTGWKLIYLNNRLFTYNTVHSSGVRVYVGRGFTNCGLNSGFWTLSCTDKRFFAFSTKNTNKGIKVCNVKTSTYTFTDIPKNNITYGDFSGGAYDRDLKKIYIGANRDDLVMNVDELIYDIDEFIYPLQDYSLQRIINEIISDKLDVLTQFVINMIKSGKDLFVLSSVLIDKLLNITVDGKTLRSVILTLDEKFQNRFEALTNPLDKAKLLLSNISTYSKLVPYETLIKEFLNENANFVDIYSILENMENFAIEMERNSSLYTELLVRSQAKQEFNITDKKTIDALTIGFINGSKFNGSLDEYYGALSRYNGDNIKYYGLYNYDKNGAQITDDKDSSEYKRIYLSTSDDYMNSDSDGTY